MLIYLGVQLRRCLGLYCNTEISDITAAIALRQMILFRYLIQNEGRLTVNYRKQGVKQNHCRCGYAYQYCV